MSKKRYIALLHLKQKDSKEKELLEILQSLEPKNN